MQSKFFAIRELVNLVENGMELVGTPMERFDDIMEHTIKTLHRHRQESEYAETELLHIGVSVRHIKTSYLDGAVVYPTPVDGRARTNLEVLDIRGAAYYPKAIVEQMKG